MMPGNSVSWMRIKEYHGDDGIAFDELEEFFHFFFEIRGPNIADLGLCQKEKFTCLDFDLFI